VAVSKLDRHRQVQVPKMAELVARQLRRQIVRGELTEGEALPSEAALMTRFGVSRPTLREAFRVLESEGLINVRRGARGGARVQTPQGHVAARYAGLILEYRSATLEDVFAARVFVESPCLGLLAKRRTAADLKKLKASVEQARAALASPEEFIALHNDFHELAISLARNETLSVLNTMLRDIIVRSSVEHVGTDAGSPANTRANRKGLRTHERVVELIEARDSEGAESLWRVHLQAAQDYLLTGHRRKTVLDLLE